MSVLIHKDLLGTRHHLRVDDNIQSFQWSDCASHDDWILGSSAEVNSLDCMLDVFGYNPISVFPEAQHKAFYELCSGSMPTTIPWHYVLRQDQFKKHVRRAVEKAIVSICDFEASGYDQTYKKIRKFLLSLTQPLVDQSKLSAYIAGNDKGMTVEGSLRSFQCRSGKAPRILYDQAGTATGRLTVKRGPRILTLPSRYRDILKPRPGMELVQIDLVSAEPRTALHVAGKSIEGDVYKQISESLNLDVTREVIKVASLSALYGAGHKMLTQKLGNAAAAKRLIRQLRLHFGVARIESQLTLEMKEKGFITNLFGRKLGTRRDEIQKAYSHFMQSTTSDAALVMFADLTNHITRNIDPEFKAVYVIHDALVCELSKDKKEEISNASKIIALESVGNYDSKMTAISE